ncbi:hypothetical protein [Anaerococcus sp. Marseille-P3915]|uniref:hypothetical protein n=1 Tax=Anaerococcus sp. Marseille-P3915 TaxID=2057799 RepID=UPI000D0AF9D3|nr:hypothetical protein [Anaerococcus sp. Marseille-P3915]
MLEDKLASLFEAENIYDVCRIFDGYFYKKSNCRIMISGYGSFQKPSPDKNMVINGYSITGFTNYDQVFYLDSRYKSKVDKLIKSNKTINFDMNILSNLKKLVKSNYENDKLLEYFNYIKEKNYNVSMVATLYEKAEHVIPNEIWMNYVLSFAKYDSIDKVTYCNLKNEYLSEKYYIWAKDIYDLEVDNQDNILYNLIVCLLAKSFILRVKKDSIKNKIIELLDFSLNVLRVYPELELYLFVLYIMKDINVKRAFEKVETISKGTFKRIENTAWDIFQIRILEKIFFSDLKQGLLSFQYIGTEDKGLQEIININPIKIIGEYNDIEINKRDKSILDIDSGVQNELETMLNNYRCVNKKPGEGVDYFKIRKNLNGEINHMEENYFS